MILLFSLLCALSLPSLCGRTEISRVLALAPFTWLGERSYSIYLFQVIGGHFVSMALPDWRNDLHKTLVVLVVTIMIADFVYRFVERPGIQVGRRIARWLAAHPIRPSYDARGAGAGRRGGAFPRRRAGAPPTGLEPVTQKTRASGGAV